MFSDGQTLRCHTFVLHVFDRYVIDIANKTCSYESRRIMSLMMIMSVAISTHRR